MVWLNRMSKEEFKCVHCGYKPRDSPLSGSWYCPRCGRRTNLDFLKPKKKKQYYRKSSSTSRSKDEVYDHIYKQFTIEEKPELGYKEPYLNPSVPPVILKKREKFRLFMRKEQI
jgi:hypothetical protein